MITYFHIENFKSLVDFDLPLAGQELGPFTCLIGLNGAGKSTVLQAFDFIAHVATGKVEEWLASRDWKKNELTSNLGVKKHVIVFALGFRPTSGPVIEWKARFNVNQLKCTWEQVSCEGNILLKLDEGRLDLLHDPASEERTILASLPFEYHGSVLSALKLGNFHWCIGEVKTQLLSLRSLELLSPQSLRRRAKKAEDIGVGGEKLSAFLSSFGPEQRDSLLTKLQEFSPSLKSWQVHTLRAGWKKPAHHGTLWERTSCGCLSCERRFTEDSRHPRSVRKQSSISALRRDRERYQPGPGRKIDGFPGGPRL